MSNRVTVFKVDDRYGQPKLVAAEAVRTKSGYKLLKRAGLELGCKVLLQRGEVFESREGAVVAWREKLGDERERLTKRIGAIDKLLEEFT